MKFLKMIINFLWRISLRFRPVQPGKVFLTAQKHCLLLRLFFVDRQRQLENVACDVLYISPQKILLKTNKSFLPDVLKNERCSLYVKIPHAIAEKYMGIKNPAVRHGFLFKSRILANSLNIKSKECCIEVAMPKIFVQRDLQRHERVCPTPLMLKEVSLWVCGKRLPVSPQELSLPVFSYHSGDENPSLRVMNLSAGGVRVQVEGLKGFDNPRRDLNRPMVLHMVLYKTSRKELPIWAVCTNVKIHYSNRLKILTLFLKYVREWDGPAEGGVGWAVVDRDGISAIEAWVNNDYCMLLDKNHMISEELCRCFGLDPAFACRESATRRSPWA